VTSFGLGFCWTSLDACFAINIDGLLVLEEATVLALEPVSFDLAWALDWEVDT
jgi:hypothetical protein